MFTGDQVYKLHQAIKELSPAQSKVALRCLVAIAACGKFQDTESLSAIADSIKIVKEEIT
jgi:hypothetical protein